MIPQDDANSIEFLRRSKKEELSEAELEAKIAAQRAMGKTLYDSLPEGEGTVASGVEQFMDGDLAVEEAESRAVEIANITNTELRQKFDLGRDDGVEVTGEESLKAALEESQEGDDSRSGIRIAKARELGIKLEKAGADERVEILKSFHHAEDVNRILQAIHDLQRKYGTVEAAAIEELEWLGGLIESAPTNDPEASELVVAEVPDDTVSKDETELAKQEALEALAAAKQIALGADTYNIENI